MLDLISQFREAIRSAGLEPPDVIEPGKLHRFPGAGKQNGNSSGWCRLFNDGQGGVFGDWSTGLSERWQAKREKPFSPAERASFSRQVEESRAQAKADRKIKQTEAATQAVAIWDAAEPAEATHAYLVAKRMKAHDLRTHDGRLVVPLRDIGGNLRTVQFIAPDSSKLYLPGGAVAGNHWAMGNLTENTPFIYLCEGVSTAAAIHEATDHSATVAAMSSGNLKTVAEALHDRYPGARVIVCADDDHATTGNPGVKAAGEAAKAVGGIVAIPQFPDPRDTKSTDWCDLLLLSGLELIKSQIDNVLATVDLFETPAKPSTPPTSHDDERIIAEMAALPPFDYDRKRGEVAKQLGVRGTTLDKVVAKKREEMEADAATPDSAVEELQPWQTPVDGRTLANEIARILAKYVVLPDGACTAISLWAVGTYCMDAWRLWPKLLITSPEKRCGKSTLLEVMEAICHRPMLTSNITAAALFRSIDLWQPCLLIDEADTFLKGNDELNGLVNCGHTKRTARVNRMVKEGEEYKPKWFKVWCPQVIAGIKNQRDTLHDRSIHIQMRRKLPGEKSTKMPIDLFEQKEEIRRKCQRWAADNIGQLKIARPTVPNFGNDRAEDNWGPVFAIAQLVGGQWPERILDSHKVITASVGEDETAGPMLLTDIKSIFEAKAVESIWSDDLVRALVAMDGRPWAEWKGGLPMTKTSLARLLKPFKVKSKQIYKNSINRHGYEKKSFEDAFERYKPEEPHEQNARTLRASDSKGFSENQNARGEDGLAFQKPLKASDSKGSSVLAFQKGYSDYICPKCGGEGCGYCLKKTNDVISTVGSTW